MTKNLPRPPARRAAALRLTVAALAISLCGRAGDSPYPNPADQPLAAVRAADASTLAGILATRPFRAVADGDAVAPDGPAASLVRPLRSFAQALSDLDAANLWLCVVQKSAFSRPRAAAGWSVGPGVNADPAAPLRELGSIARKYRAETRATRPGENAVVVAPDSATMRAMLDTGAPPGGKWRESLNGFFGDRAGTLGVWFATRPVLGLASLLLRIDPRAALKPYNLSIPDTVRVEFAAADADLGCEVRLDSFLPPGFAGRAPRNGRVLSAGGDNLLEASVVDPAALFTALEAPGRFFALANLDADALTPESVNLAIGRDASGTWRWSLTALLPAAPGVRTQANRFLALTELANGAPSGGGDAGEARPIRIGGVSAIARILSWRDEDGTERLCLALADREDALPASEKLEARPSRKNAVLEWNVRLDPAARREAAAAFASRLGNRLDAGVDIDALFPEGDRGAVAARGSDLTVSSESLLTPMLLPFAQEAFAEAAGRRNDALAVAAKRLRFLLEVAGQTRFRRIPLDAPPRNWPGVWAEINVAAEGRWIDAVFRDFPHSGQSASANLARIAAGEAIDGVVYRILSDGGKWRIAAESGGNEFLRVDSSGKMELDDGGGWREWCEPGF